MDALEYRFDFVVHSIKYSVMIIIMSLVWRAVGEASGDARLVDPTTVSYFFWAAILYALSNFHPMYINEDINKGSLSKYLLKPITPYFYYFSWETGVMVLETILKLVMLLPIMWLLKLPLFFDPIRTAIFMVYMVGIVVFAYALQATIAYLSFWLTQAYAIRWAILVVIRFLAGILVPIWLLPTWYQHISPWLPFQYLAYTPIQLMLFKISINEALTGLVFLAFWCIVMLVIQRVTWVAGLKTNEMVGN